MHPSQQSLMIDAETVSKVLEIHSILAQLITQEDFTVFGCHETFKSDKVQCYFKLTGCLFFFNNFVSEVYHTANLL
jgi:hypothetical protein